MASNGSIGLRTAHLACCANSVSTIG